MVGSTFTLPFTWLPAVVLGILAATTVVVLWMVQRGRERRRRMDLLEAALRNPNLTPDVQRDLAHALRPPATRWTFSLAWLGLFGGIAWLLCEPRGDEFTAAVVTSTVSFALLTLPFALRELDARRA